MGSDRPDSHGALGVGERESEPCAERRIILISKRHVRVYVQIISVQRSERVSWRPIETVIHCAGGEFFCLASTFCERGFLQVSLFYMGRLFQLTDEQHGSIIN